MQQWLATTVIVASARTATACPLNSRSTRSTRLLTQLSVKPLVSRTTTHSAEKLSWDIQQSGAASSLALVDGSTLMTTIRRWMPNTWRVFGVPSRKSTTKTLSTEAQRSCLFLLLVIPCYRTSKQSKTIKKSLIPPLLLLSQHLEINTNQALLRGLPCYAVANAVVNRKQLDSNKNLVIDWAEKTNGAWALL